MPNLTLLKSDQSSELPTIVFAGGGTGGHLIPAVALARELESMAEAAGNPVRIEFLIPGKKLERTILEDHGMSYTLCGGISPAGNVVRKAKAALSLYKAYRSCKNTLKQIKPLAMIGVGGYGSVCGGLAARSQKVPLYLLEQNTMPGRVNRLMSRYAEAMFAQWPLVKDVKCPVEVLGNPTRSSLAKLSRSDAQRKLGLNPERKTLLVMGGSQGASAINNFVLNNFETLDERSRRVQVIHLTGEPHFDSANTAWAMRIVNNLVLPYVGDMSAVLAASDLVLCRAGATTIAELTSLGKPMVLVPLPSAAEDHQRLNAEYVQSFGADDDYEQSKLDSPDVMRELLDEILLDDRTRASMALRSLTLGKVNAGASIASRVLSGIGLQVTPQAVESMDETRRAA